MDFSPKRLIKLLQERGWVLDRIKGSHHIFFNEETGETIQCQYQFMEIRT